MKIKAKTTIIDALHRIKDEVEYEKNTPYFMENLVEETGIKREKIELYYQLISLLEQSKKECTSTLIGQRMWHESEKALIILAVKETHGIIPKTKVFKLISPILNRTYNSISFCYYNDISKMSESKEDFVNRVQEMYEEENIEHMEHEENDVQAEVLVENSIETPIKTKTEETIEKPKDSLDELALLIENVQKIEGFNLEMIFSGLATLSTLAVKNSPKTDEFERKIEEQQAIITQQEEEIQELKEKQKLMMDMLNEYESLDTLQKVAQLKSYHHRLREATK